MCTCFACLLHSLAALLHVHFSLVSKHLSLSHACHVHVRFLMQHLSMLDALHMLAFQFSVCTQVLAAKCRSMVAPRYVRGDNGLVSPAANGRQLIV